METNLRTYSSLFTLYKYRYRSSLTSVEQSLFSDVAHSRSLRVLDLGVGTGRTSSHFRDFENYIGLDYSPVMVEWCRKQFRDSNGRRFVLGDARKLPFPTGSFDVVIFSFNGLDYVSPDGRKKIYQEVFRVLSPNGVFLFSTHNIRSLTSSPRISEGFLRTLSDLWRAFVIRILNLKLNIEALAQQDRVMIRDLPTLVTHYISLSAQRAELSESGFMIRRVQDEDGMILYPSTEERDPRGKWFYVLAEKSEIQVS